MNKVVDGADRFFVGPILCGGKMNIRERMEVRELFLHDYAAKSKDSKGREVYEEPDEVRTCYARDRDRIIHSHAFRREQHKTQVFINPSNDHIMNRMTHTLEVAQIAKTIAVSLNLNEVLTEAIALGHDTAHTCFGHAGESALNKICLDNGMACGYKHAEASYRRLNVLSGLNLTHEVLDGIRRHSGLSNGSDAETLEGQIIQFADKIAYLTSDYENAISMGLVGGFEDLPKEVLNQLGNKKSKIIDTLIKSVINRSTDNPYIKMDDDCYGAFAEFRKFNFKNIYYHPRLVESNNRAKMIVNCLFEYYKGQGQDIQGIVDNIAGMTDSFALNEFHSLL